MRFVGLTAGLVKPNTLTWNGSSRNAPDTPAGAVRADTKKATSRGNSGLSSVPGPGKYIQHSGLYRNLADQQRSIGSIYPTAEKGSSRKPVFAPPQTLCVRIEAMALPLLHAPPVECLLYGGADNEAERCTR